MQNVFRFISKSGNSSEEANGNPDNAEAPSTDSSATDQETTSIKGGDVSSTEAKSTSQSSNSSRSQNQSSWSEPVQTLLDQPPAALPYRVLAGGIVFSLAFAAWAWFGHIEEVGTAQGQLVPKGRTYKVDPTAAGKVANISVEEGEVVKKGEALAKLNTKLAKQKVERLQQSLNSYKGELEKKQATLQKVRSQAQSRTEIATTELQAQRAAIAQAKEQAETTRQVLAQLQSEVTDHRERLEKMKPLVQEGAISQEYVFKAEQALRDRLSAVTQKQGELSAATKKAKQLQAQLAQKQAQKRNIRSEAQQQIQQLEIEIAQLNSQIAETKNLLASAQEKLQQKFLRAPVAGTVLSLNLQNTGKVVKPGQTIAEIAPKSAPMVLSAYLPTREAGSIEKGMPVKIKFDAYPYQDYGVVPGTVTSISPDTESHKRLGEVYRVKVALDRDEFSNKQEAISFKAGQTANADIVIRRRRIADVILEPIKKLQAGGLNL
jgi:HlyD family secretion protein